MHMSACTTATLESLEEVKTDQPAAGMVAIRPALQGMIIVITAVQGIGLT